MGSVADAKKKDRFIRQSTESSSSLNDEVWTAELPITCNKIS